MTASWDGRPHGKSVLFASQRGEGFMPRLYTVAVTGGLPRDAGPDMGVEACFSPDGQKIAVNRKAQSYWRKSYRGSYQSDVTVMDLASKTFKDVATSDGMDSWPMWSKDGHIYFVSDREGNGLSNLFRVPEGGGEAEKVTSFNAGDVRFPAMSADGKTIVFEHDFSAWKLDLASKQAVAMKFDISAETQENLTEYRDFNSEADDYALAPDGKRVAFSIRGEVFTAPTDEGDLVQITDGAARDQNVEYSPDGKSLSFVSDQTGREEIFAAPADGVGETRKITDLDALEDLIRVVARLQENRLHHGRRQAHDRLGRRQGPEGSGLGQARRVPRRGLVARRQVARLFAAPIRPSRATCICSPPTAATRRRSPSTPARR